MLCNKDLVSIQKFTISKPENADFFEMLVELKLFFPHKTLKPFYSYKRLHFYDVFMQVTFLFSISRNGLVPINNIHSRLHFYDVFMKVRFV